MIRKDASPETLEKINSFCRMPFETFKELIALGDIIPSCKLKTSRTIFYDDSTEHFVYLNPYFGELVKCGEWYIYKSGE